MGHALIVEDDVDSARMMAALVTTEGFSAATAHSLRDARRMMALQQPDVILLDLLLPDGSGMALFDDAESVANCDIVLMTGHASLETSIQALRLGAADYLVKPVNMKHLQGVLSRVTRPSVLHAERENIRSEWKRTGQFGHLVGRSAVMENIFEQISRVAGTSISVFITGESGTGKELVARTVHDLSRRRKKPFLAVNCGAITPSLMESEIFGHEKGSFTGADRQHQGFFERAHLGTLFLDEITEMPPELQVKLLRVLETGSFSRVGSTETIQTNVRIVAATNRDVAQAVASGALREDLMYRLNVFPISMPPLRDRMDDLPMLARHFLKTVSEREGTVKQMTSSAFERLQEYAWPGNVRELRNVVQRAYVMADHEITGEWMPRNVPQLAPQNLPQPPSSEPAEKTIDAPVVGSATSSGAASSALQVQIGAKLSDIERDVILATWKLCGQHKERTAAMLGVSIKTLYNRLKEYGIQDGTGK